MHEEPHCFGKSYKRGGLGSLRYMSFVHRRRISSGNEANVTTVFASLPFRVLYQQQGLSSLGKGRQP